MKKKFFSTIGIIALCSLLVTIVVTGQQANQTTVTFRDLTFKIIPVKDSFLPMEPIPLNISLSNNTASTILGNSDITFNSLYIELLVTNEQGTTVKIPNLETARYTREICENKPIPSGKSFTSRQIFYTLNTTFPQTGMYKIQGIFYDCNKEQQVRSELVTIRIVAPSNREQEVYEILKPLNKRGFFFAGDLSADQDLTKTEDIVTRFPETRYGDYAAYLLGRIYRARGDRVRAMQMFQRLVLRPDFPLLDEVRRLLLELENMNANTN